MTIKVGTKTIRYYKVIDLMDYEILCDPLEKIDIVNNKLNICTLNAYSYVMANKDKQFKLALKDSDLLVPDGFPMVLAARFILGIKIRKIAGEDLFYHFCNLMNKRGGKCFFLGSSETTLQKIINRLQSQFPRINAEIFSPPFKESFSDEDNKIMLDTINVFAPDVLFIGMTAPKQEKWAAQFKNEIRTKIICSIGAVFDFYAGTITRPSKFWIKLNLEWFIRLIKEPRRLWKRYLIYSPWFFAYMFQYKLKTIFHRTG